MPRLSPAARLASLFALVLAACGGSGTTTGGSDTTGCTEHNGSGLAVLVFSRTTGFRHSSIEAGVRAICRLAQERDWRMVATEQATVFDKDQLAAFQVVVWLNTTGDVLDKTQEAAFESYIVQGGGFVGIHAAADTEYDWPFYGRLVGAYFAGHPPTQQATIHVEDRTHPATKTLPATWQRTDEWYDYDKNPRGDVRVLATVDEATYSGGSMGSDHPIMWTRTEGAGRAFYSGLGHTSESFAEPLFLDVLAGAIEWAGGIASQQSAGHDTLGSTNDYLPRRR